MAYISAVRSMRKRMYVPYVGMIELFLFGVLANVQCAEPLAKEYLARRCFIKTYSISAYMPISRPQSGPPCRPGARVVVPATKASLKVRGEVPVMAQLFQLPWLRKAIGL